MRQALPPGLHRLLTASAGWPGSRQLADLREMRALLDRMLRAAGDRREVTSLDLRRLNTAAGRAGRCARLVRLGDAWTAEVAFVGGGPHDALVAVIAGSGVDVLARPTPPRRCSGPGCRLLFVGGHPRRTWCDSRTCGNRVRVARHTRRQPNAHGSPANPA